MRDALVAARNWTKTVGPRPAVYFGEGRWDLIIEQNAYSPTIGRSRLPAVEVALEAGVSRLQLRITGANEFSAGHKAGLDAVVLERLP